MTATKSGNTVTIARDLVAAATLEEEKRPAVRVTSTQQGFPVCLVEVDDGEKACEIVRTFASREGAKIGTLSHEKVNQ